jgi:hypothetical protein
MATRTRLFQLLPWTGGLVTSIDESLIPPGALTVADNLIFDTRGSRKKRGGINHNWDSGSITDISMANPTVITSNSHGLTTGDTITISGSNSTPTINGSRTVTVTSANTFTVPVNVTVAGTTGTWILTNGSDKIIRGHDFWYGASSRTQKQFAIASDGSFYTWNTSGTRTAVSDGGTAYTGTLTSASIITYNNKAIIAVSGSGNVLKYWDGTNPIADVPGTPPIGSILCEHLGRLWTNDKSNLDRIHYSPTHDHSLWNGSGDSGAFDIGIGDGDPGGITAIWSFRGDLYVAKKTKLYRVAGHSPETMQIIKISDSIGCMSHNSVANIDTEDVYWVSEKGIHSLRTTDSYGDVSSAYISTDIQKTFNDDIDRSSLANCQAAYLPTINSVAFAFQEDTSLNRVLTDTSSNNAIYLYNVVGKWWYRWPDLSCTSIWSASDSDARRIYIGTKTTRVSKAFNGTKYDVSAAGTSTAVNFRVETGIIFADQNPYSVKAVKRFLLYYRPRGAHRLSATIKIDNFSISPENQLTFDEVYSSALLGSTFILGTSVLGYEVVLGAYTRMIDGVGKGFKLALMQNDIDSEVEIQGFGVEFEAAGSSPEVYLT